MRWKDSPRAVLAFLLVVHVIAHIDRNMSSVKQIEMMVRLARELGREVASGTEARSIYQVGEFWKNTDETLARLGMTPNRAPGQRGVPLRHAA